MVANMLRNTKEQGLIGGGVIVLILIIGLLFWFWQGSKDNSIQYENAKHFEADGTSSPVAAQSEESAVDIEEELTEAKQAELVAEEKARAAEITPEESAPKPKEEKDIAPKGFSIKSRLVSFGHESASGRDIDAIVLHSSYGVNGDPYDVDDVIALWKSYGVAPHYMIARDGTVYQLVADKNIAYHAGESKMPDGRSGVNNFSIGVEILNTKTDKYTSAQYQAVKDLISYLKGKYGKMTVVGHDTIAPGRKSDPWNFDWDKI